MTTISIIAAVAANGVIGFENCLPWRQSADLKRLKALTMGHHLVMGRKTFDSIGHPLQGRTIVVITRNAAFAMEGILRAGSLDEAVHLAAGDDEIFIAGGAEIYRQAIPITGRLHLTRIHAEPEGDAFFPELDMTHWRLVDAEHYEADEKNQYPYSFLTYERAGSPEHFSAEYTEAG